MDSMYGIGSILGLLVAAIFSEIWVDFYRTDTIVDLDPGDPEWVGAWWIATGLAGLLFIFITIPFFCFPSKLPEKTKNVRNGEPEAMVLHDEENAGDVQKLPSKEKPEATSVCGKFIGKLHECYDLYEIDML